MDSRCSNGNRQMRGRSQGKKNTTGSTRIKCCEGSDSESNTSSFIIQFGEQAHVKNLGDNLATVVEVPGDDETILVQYDKIRLVQNSKSNNAAYFAPRLKNQGHQSEELQSFPGKQQ